MNNNNLNILYHHRTQGRGAEGVHISSIVNALEKLGHTVTVLSPPGVDPLQNAGNAPVDKSNVKTSGIDSLWKFISKHIPNMAFELIEVLYNIPASRRLESELANNNYDIIYERYAFYMFAGARKAKKYNIPFVLEANEVSGIKERARKQSFKKLCGLFERYIFKRCTSIHTVSSYLKNMIVKQGVAADIIEVTPNAINPDVFNGCRHVDNLATKYNLTDITVLGFAGWFDNWDRLDLLVDVFAKLKVNNKNLKLLLIGDGAVLDEVRTKMVTLNLEDDVILTGAVQRSEIRKYLSLLDIAVITHSNEFGSPVVMFEFMGLGIPIVAPKLLPITDVLTHDKDALLFDILDMNDLEIKLNSMINHMAMRKRLSTAAYTKLVSEHTWSRNAENIIHTSGVFN